MASGVVLREAGGQPFRGAPSGNSSSSDATSDSTPLISRPPPPVQRPLAKQPRHDLPGSMWVRLPLGWRLTWRLLLGIVGCAMNSYDRVIPA